MSKQAWWRILSIILVAVMVAAVAAPTLDLAGGVVVAGEEEGGGGDAGGGDAGGDAGGEGEAAPKIPTTVLGLLINSGIFGWIIMLLDSPFLMVCLFVLFKIFLDIYFHNREHNFFTGDTHRINQ